MWPALHAQTARKLVEVVLEAEKISQDRVFRSASVPTPHTSAVTAGCAAARTSHQCCDRSMSSQTYDKQLRDALLKIEEWQGQRMQVEAAQRERMSKLEDAVATQTLEQGMSLELTQHELQQLRRQHQRLQADQGKLMEEYRRTQVMSASVAGNMACPVLVWGLCIVSTPYGSFLYL